MKTFRMTLFALVALAGFGLVSSPSLAVATDLSWLSNKEYLKCLQLFANGNFLIPANATPAQRDATHEKGRRYCNKTYGY
jgi:hypothetical protein